MSKRKSPTFRQLYRLLVLFVVLVLVVGGAILIVLPHLWTKIEPDSTAGFIIRDFGVAALIAGLVGCGYEFVLRGAFSADIKENLLEVINERSGELDNLRQAGIKTLHRRLPHAGLSDRFETATSSIRILQTWSGDFNALGRSLKEAAERECEIQILLLDPYSEQADFRGRDLGYEEYGAVRSLINNDLATLRKLFKDSGESVRKHIHVRLYDSTPVVAMYGFDSTTVVGTYWRGIHSQEGPQIVVSQSDAHTNNDYEEAVNTHFNNLWNDPETRDFDWERKMSPRRPLDFEMETLRHKAQRTDQLEEELKTLHEIISNCSDSQGHCKSLNTDNEAIDTKNGTTE